jgi:predicted ribosome quality control (RQC) complex YloA/Tae2 family protein
MYKAIMDNYRGIGPLIGKEITYRAGFNPEATLETTEQIPNLETEFNDLFTNINQERFTPTLIYTKEEKLKDYNALDITQFNLPKKTFSSINKLLDYYFTTRLTNREIDNLTNKLNQVVSNNLDKANKKYNRVTGQLKGAKNADKYQLKGELITAHIHELERGQKKVKLPNYYTEDNEKVTIELDPDLSPAENAQKYFEKYDKAKKRIKPLRREAKKTKKELDYLENVDNSIQQAKTLEELTAIEQELIEEGYITPSLMAKTVLNQKNYRL